MIGLGVPRRRDRVPGAGPQGVLGEGAPRRAAQGGRRAGRRHGGRHRSSAGACSSCSPAPWPARTGFLYALNRVSAFAGADSDSFDGHPARLRQRAARPVRRAGADGRRDRAVPIAARRERAHRRGRVGHPRPARAVRQERLARLLRHPPRQGGGVRAQRPRGDHLPRRGRRLPGQRRPGRRSEGLAAGDRGVAGAVPDVRLGARRDGRQFERRAQAFREPGLNALQLGDEAILHPDSFRLSGPGHARGAPGRDPGAAGRAATVRIRRHRDIAADEMAEVDRAGRRLARHRDRARLLDGAGPARRPRRRRLPAGRGRADDGSDDVRRDAVAGAVGHQRGVAGPDAPLARNRPTAPSN